MLIEQYDAAVSCADIVNDPAQREVIVHMQQVADSLAALQSRWFQWGRKQDVSGLYLHGPVGVGKTYLVDLFYQNVMEPRKARFHFHHFMQQVDTQLRQLQGTSDPLKRIASQVAKTTQLLCLDEFLVHDVADAMILAELLQALLIRGVVLIATSNTPPDELYLHGVQRDRFLPAIQLIKQHCDIVALARHDDYRLGRASFRESYFYPLNEKTAHAMLTQFNREASVNEEHGVLCVQHREIAYVRCASRVVWFRFDVICNLPRCQLDYLELAERFDTVFVSEVPELLPEDIARVILLIHLIDVMYDRGLRVVMSAAVPLDKLYLSGEMQRTFQRTLSRLQEMQSEDYLHRHQRRTLQSLGA